MTAVQLESISSLSSATSALTQIYSSREAALAVCTDGQIVIQAKKNNTKGNTGADDGWQLFACVPDFSVRVDPGYDEIINAVLIKQANDSFKSWRLSNPVANEVPLQLFTSEALREAYLVGDDSGISFTREELERAFCGSATWKRISGSDRFKQVPAYRNVANQLKEKIISLAGRSYGSITNDQLDLILAKIEDDDFSTQFGAFVVRKIQQIRKSREDSEASEVSLSDL